jgi:hypothetical protein
LDTSSNFTVTKRGDDVTCDLRSFTLEQGTTILVSATTQLRARLGAKPTLAGQGRLEADLGALLQQPAAADLATLSRGRATLTFDGSFADTVDAKLSLTARDLVAKQGNRPLGNLETSAEAKMKADGTGTFTLPLTLSTPTRKSDVTIAGTLAKPAAPGAIAFTGRITSTQLFVEDFQPLAALAPATPTTSTPPPTASPAPTTTRGGANRRGWQPLRPRPRQSPQLKPQRVKLGVLERGGGPRRARPEAHRRHADRRGHRDPRGGGGERHSPRARRLRGQVQGQPLQGRGGRHV